MWFQPLSANVGRIFATLDADVEARYPLKDVRAALAHHARPGRRGKILLVS
jgi:hypothetical protein